MHAGRVAGLKMMEDLLDNMPARVKNLIIANASRTNEVLVSAALRLGNQQFAFMVAVASTYADKTSLSVQRRGFFAADNKGGYDRYVMADRSQVHDEKRRRFEMIKQNGRGGSKKLLIDKDGSLIMHGSKKLIPAGSPVFITQDTCRIDIMIESALARTPKDPDAKCLQYLHLLGGGTSKSNKENLLHEWLDTKVIHEKPEGLLQYERALKRSRTYIELDID
jgi:hypothetical protein